MACDRYPECYPTSYELAPSTSDGKPTYRPVCQGGNPGGCNQLASYEQVLEFDQKNSPRNVPQTPPVWISKLGQVYGPNWDAPQVIKEENRKK